MMKVSRRMQRKIHTVQKGETVERAHTIMAVNNIRHLPVLDGERLVGILSDRDIRGVLIPHNFSPSGKNSSTFYLPRDVKVQEAMTPEPIWVRPGSDIEEAARLLVTHKIGGLPVVDRGRVVGIITETDILWVFCEIMGVLESSCRVDVALGSSPKAMEKATEIIRLQKGRIISVGILPSPGKGKKVYSFRLRNCDTAPIVEELKRAGFKVVDEIG